jgi:hypothetical protein
MARESIKLTKAALDESPQGDIIIRGLIAPASLSAIKIASYQRETLSLKQLSSLIKAFKDGENVPDITLGMRGGGFLERDSSLYLQDDTFVIDGLQRISAAMHCMRTGDQINPHLGCIVYSNTTVDSERELFTVLNTRKAKLSPNVLVRNLREENQAVAMIFDLTDEQDFVLNDRVCWQQNMRRHELLTALTVVKTAGVLHSSFGTGTTATQYDQACANLERCMLEAVGRKVMMGNIKTFFGVMDMAWGVRSVAFKAGASYLKTGFLLALGNVFAKHRNFWDSERRLIVPADVLSKLKTFPVADPQVRVLAVGSSAATAVLQGLIVDHLNKGKTVRRMVPFKESDSAALKKAASKKKTTEAAVA